MRIVYFFIAICFFCSCSAQKVRLTQAPNNNTLLWEISGKEISKPSYLFGTFHLLCKEDIHFSDNFLKAVSFVDEVYFEMNLDDPSNTLGGLLFMNMKDQIKLKDLYSDAEYIRLEKFIKDSLGTSLVLFQRMKPMFLQALLYPKLLSCNNTIGLEQEIMKLAKQHKKLINGFETIRFQAAVFDSIPYQTQAKELLKSIDSLNNYTTEFKEMVHIYATQQMSEMEKLFIKSEFGTSDNLDVLLFQRNKNWVAQLKDILPKKSVFIGVGAGHLVGDLGLIALLKKEGYTLKPILNK